MVNASAPTTDPACPICERPFTSRRPKTLYDLSVCRKCWARFLNRRQGAFVMDWLLIAVGLGMVVDMLLTNAMNSLTGTPSSAGVEAFLIVVNWIIFPLVFFLKDGFSGISPGKWLADLQVLDRTSFEPIGFGASLKRNLILIIPFMALLLAFRLGKGHRLGDRWANTRVVWRRYAHRPPFDVRGVLCLGCGYDLTGNVSGRCPECGLEVAKQPPGGPEQ